jgi:hypothetical protein
MFNGLAQWLGGPLIPASIILIIHSVATGQSIARLFVAGLAIQRETVLRAVMSPNSNSEAPRSSPSARWREDTRHRFGVPTDASDPQCAGKPWEIVEICPANCAGVAGHRGQAGAISLGRVRQT